MSRVEALNPLTYVLACMTTGGPATRVVWSRSRENHLIASGIGTGTKAQHITDYEDYTYVNEMKIRSGISEFFNFYAANIVPGFVHSTLDISGDDCT